MRGGGILGLAVGMATGLCQTAFAETFHLRDGRVIEAEVSYQDREETFVTVIEGVEASFKNDEIASIEPGDSPIISRVYTDARNGFRIQGPPDWVMLTPDILYHKALTQWHSDQRVRFYKYPYRSYFTHPEQYDPTPGVLNPAVSVIVSPIWSLAGRIRDPEEGVRSRGASVKIVDGPRSQLIHGNVWTTLTSVFDVSGMRVRSMDLFLEKRGKSFWLSVSDKAENFDKNWPAFSQTIESCSVN